MLYNYLMYVLQTTRLKNMPFHILFVMFYKWIYEKIQPGICYEFYIHLFLFLFVGNVYRILCSNHPNSNIIQQISHLYESPESFGDSMKWVWSHLTFISSGQTILFFHPRVVFRSNRLKKLVLNNPNKAKLW